MNVRLARELWDAANRGDEARILDTLRAMSWDERAIVAIASKQIDRLAEQVNFDRKGTGL